MFTPIVAYCRWCGWVFPDLIDVRSSMDWMSECPECKSVLVWGQSPEGCFLVINEKSYERSDECGFDGRV